MSAKSTNPVLSVLTHKCPKCRKGNMFTHPNPYRYKGYFEMPNKCPHCGQKFLLEPGFYYGAMYANYGVTIALSVSIFGAMYVLGENWELHEYLIGIFLGLISTAPYTFRLARVMWISFFVGYDKDAAAKGGSTDHQPVVSQPE